MIRPTPTIRYRAKQFFAALKPDISSDDTALIQSTFTENPQALELFYRMDTRDRQHGVAVLRTLLAQNHHHPALLQAALLHDVGKAMGQPLFYRVAVVLLHTVWPAGLTRLGQGPLTCAVWRRPFVINLNHPHIGATWAAEAGCDALVVELIETHQHQPADRPQTLTQRLHRALYNADGEN